MHKRFAALGLFLATAATGAQAQDRLPPLDRGMPGPRTQVLVLGTVHLSQLKTFKPESMQSVMDRLAAFKPQIITIEALSGEQCDLIARYPDVYTPEDFAPYCKSTELAKAATGLDVPAAIAQVHRTLRDWPAAPAPAQRRHLASLFLAAGERASALVQWLQLPADERKAGDGLDAALVELLGKLETTNNEDYVIAARLAARLGLVRVFSADDHTGDAAQFADAKAYGDAVQAAWNAAEPRVKAMREREDALTKADDLLPLYRFVNDPDVLRKTIEADFGAALQDPSPQRYGRQYVSGWEARNVRMVGNIRVAFRDRPGARVLSIVGMSHKPWFDVLLGQMLGVDVVDTLKILK